MAYYDEDSMNDESSPSQAEDDEKESDTKSKDKMEYKGQQALLPKSILMGKEFKPGDEVVLKIDELMDDEILVSYATGEEKDEGEDSMNKDSKDMKESMDQLESSYS